MPLICTECGWAEWSLLSAAREAGGSRVPLPRRTNRCAHTARCHARSVQSPRAPAGQKWFKWVVCMQHPQPVLAKHAKIEAACDPCAATSTARPAPACAAHLMPSFGARCSFPGRSASPLHPASPQRRKRRPCAASRCPARGHGRARPAQRRWARAQARPVGAAPALTLAQAHPVGAAPLGAGLPEGDRVRGAVDQERVAGHAELRTVLVVAAVACAARADMMGRAHARRPPLAGRSRGLGRGGAAKDSRGVRALRAQGRPHSTNSTRHFQPCFAFSDVICQMVAKGRAPGTGVVETDVPACGHAGRGAPVMTATSSARAVPSGVRTRSVGRRALYAASNVSPLNSGMTSAGCASAAPPGARCFVRVMPANPNPTSWTVEQEVLASVAGEEQAGQRP